MALNKKHKKQIEVHRKKIAQLQKLLNDAKAQPDDPEEIPRLQAEIKEHETAIDAIKAEA